MNNKPQKEIKFLKLYSGVLSIAVLVIIIYLFNQSREKTFKEISVERINIVESNGDLKLVISNSEKQHSGAIDGEALPERERPAGLIFFNSVGDECGGLIFDGNEENAGLVLSVDKFRDDQVMQLQYMENTKSDKRKYGLQLWDFPKEDTFSERFKRFNSLKKLQGEARSKALEQMKRDSLLASTRLFVGKSYNKEVGMFINDSKGNPRIRLFIDAENNPVLEFLDESGNVISRK